MKLHSLKIEGYKRLKNCQINFGQATFLIGENNVGKSSVLKAIEILLSTKGDKLSAHDYSMLFNVENNENERQVDKVVLTGEFRNVPENIVQFRGFNKSRLLKYETESETGYKIVYRKTFEYEKKAKIEILTYSKERKPEFTDCKKPNDFIDNGIERQIIVDLFGENSLDKNITTKNSEHLEEIDEIWNIDTTEEKWIENPGGIPQNVLSKLPKYLLIPAIDKADEITGKNGAMHEIMNQLFEEVREQSENFKKAQEFLTKLEKELDPIDDKSEFGILMVELNTVLDSVFPTSKLHTEADLSDPNKVLKPTFNIEMSSNIKTPVDYQGTGMIRTVAFSLLKFREIWKQKKTNNDFDRALIIGFEEPEIYLHPNAANQMRNTIYDIASENTQIVCSTHSPFMIDLSRKPNQILNNLFFEEGFVKSVSFSISDKFKELQEDDRTYVKMLQKIDDYVSRMFFAKRVIIVEGDTEEIVLKKSIELFPEEIKKQVLSDIQIIKARGKAVIISLVKYLKSMNIKLFVIHDRDKGTEGAEKFNKPILDAVGDDKERLMMEECIEDELGYEVPSADKPLKAYHVVEEWKKFDDIPENWRNKLKIIFSEYFE
jgi:predicted ATP-dependent endonuclease of OLD family